MASLETRICGRCGMEKSIDEFGFRYVKLGVRHSWCKSCFVEYKRVWYIGNREKHIEHVRGARDQTSDENQPRMWQYSGRQPCGACGERAPGVRQVAELGDGRQHD